ncbi:hypothetical protein K2173_007560 [Erythroxylum novogranatense]|uniref:B box-type domain-containing protein n=1 Tax=Erythroxylum novogranatense TaxID=1862640 RepID=A0AAV8T6L2_9ROSI|nr:hypothetical protein K2173_007560 [Erythroxylum novogranatense]
MKIQCDVCNKEEASVFCTADEAALCEACDHQVHHVNKLASKHHRLSLLQPSPKTFPLCDICQDKRAFLFCQQDRALLCKDCDVPIHTGNEHTRKHDRFLLTGVKLSSKSVKESSDLVPDSKYEQKQPTEKKLHVSVVPINCIPPTIAKTLPSTTMVNEVDCCNVVSGDQGTGLTSSSISEYLIEMLPGWHVEDFLDSTWDPLGFCKPDDGTLPFAGTNLGSKIGCLSSENMGVWIPPATNTVCPSQVYPQKVFKETSNVKLPSRSWANDVFTVPQISPPSSGFKRSRPS